MHVVIHVSKHYDWDPLPEGVKPTEADIAAKRVKPSANGKWLMRVKKERATYTTTQLPEQQIVAYLLGEAIRSKRVLTRKEAVAEYLSRHIMGHHAHRKWMEKVEVTDSGPDEALFSKMLAEQVVSGHIDEDDAPDLAEAYLETATDEHHAAHISSHFGIQAPAAGKSKESGR